MSFLSRRKDEERSSASSFMSWFGPKKGNSLTNSNSEVQAADSVISSFKNLEINKIKDFNLGAPSLDSPTKKISSSSPSSPMPSLKSASEIELNESRSPSAPPMVRVESFQPVEPQDAVHWIKNYNPDSCKSKLPDIIYDSCSCVARVDVNYIGVASGIMISTDFLLTVRHCLVEDVPLSSIKVLFGHLKPELNGEYFAVDSIIYPDDPLAIDKNLLANKTSDFMILKLKSILSGSGFREIFPGDKYGFKELVKLDPIRPKQLFFMGYSNKRHLKISEINVRPVELTALIPKIQERSADWLNGRPIFWNNGLQCGTILSLEKKETGYFFCIEMKSKDRHFLYVINDVVYSGRTKQPLQSQVFVGFSILFGEDHIIVSHKVFQGGSGGVFLTNDGFIYAVLMGRLLVPPFNQHLAQIPTIPAVTRLFQNVLLPEATKDQRYLNDKESKNIVQLYIIFVLEVESVANTFESDSVRQIIGHFKEFFRQCPQNFSVETAWNNLLAKVKSPSLQSFKQSIKKNGFNLEVENFIRSDPKPETDLFFVRHFFIGRNQNR